MDIRRQHREQIMGATGATPDEAELINMVIDATGMSRDRLSFARAAVQGVDEAGRPRRAAVDFYEDGKTVIRFFETADRTSPVHEISHVVRRRVLDRRIDPEYRMGLTDQDIKLIEDYVGVRDGEWDINAEENWAQLFERFMWDGVAPNHAVASIMARSAEMMRAVYSRVEANRLLRDINPEEWAAAGGVKGPEINPQVRRVMNKLMSRAPVTVDGAIRAFNRAGKRSAFSSLGHSLRTMMAASDNFLNPPEAADAIDGVYREERLYQSAKRTGPMTTDEAYPVKRGRVEIVNRLRREVMQGDLSTDDMEKMQRLIEAVPPELLDVMGLRFRQSKSLGRGRSGQVLGAYSLNRNIVTIASDLVRGGDVKNTWSHEWGHAIASFLGDDIVKSLKDDYTRSYNKFVRLEGVDPRAKDGTQAFKDLRNWLAQNPSRWSEVYGLMNLDEWNAMGFQSAAWRQLDIQENTRTFIGYSRYAFHNLMLNIKSIWGGAVHERIARDILDADFRASKKARADLMRRFKLGKFAPKSLAGESPLFRNWDERAAESLKRDQRFMFRDFDAAAAARTSGEVKGEFLPYRMANRLGDPLDTRGFPTGQVPPPPPKVTTLFQSAEPGSPDFKRLTEGTKIVDDAGEPLRLFHGTPAKGVKDLDPNMAMEVRGAVFFTDNMDVADGYIYERDIFVAEPGAPLGQPGQVIEASLRIKNPMEVDFKGEVGDAARISKLVDEAKKKGHDGLIIRNVDDTVDSSGKLGTSYAVFNKDQIVQRPAKETLFQSATPDFSPEQLEWAKESKIRTQDGSSPMIVYHASNAEAPIRVFDRAKQGVGQFGKGFYFTGNETRVKDYGSNVGAYILDMRKPFDVADDNNLRLMYDFERSLDLEKFGARAANKDTDKNWKQYLAETKKLQEKRSSNEYYDSSFLVDVRMSMWESAELSRVNEWLESKGYDGVIGYHEGRRQSPEYIVFRENQIKALENKAPTRGPDTMYQSAFPGGPTQPIGGQPPQRPFNIENMSTADDVRAFHDIRLQELEADGRVAYNSMSRVEQVAAAEQELGRVADFTGYRTVPELTAALRNDEDALQGFMSRHLATRMMLSEAGTQLIQAREAAMTSGSRADLARFVAMQQRVDVLLEHTRRNQAAIARGLGSQNIVPGPGMGAVRLIDDSMLQDQRMVEDIISSSGGEEAIRNAMRISRAAEARAGQAGAVRATQGGHHGIMPVLTEYWMNSILSGPITFAVNATSNTAAMLYAPLEQALGAGITRNFPLVRESLMRYGAFLTEIRESLAYAGVALRTGDNILDAAAPNALGGTGSRRQRAISAAAMGFEDNSRLGAFVNLLGTVINAPGSALGATDEFFKQMNYRSTVRAGLIADAMQEVAAGRLARDQMGNFVETRFQRMVDQGQFYSERKIRADANNAAAAEIAAGTFTQNSAEHLQFVRQYIRDNWNEADGELARRARTNARDATFTNDLRRDTPGFEGISAGIQQLVNEHPSLRILIPFIRTPANLALYFGQRTPIPESCTPRRG